MVHPGPDRFDGAVSVAPSGCSSCGFSILMPMSPPGFEALFARDPSTLWSALQTARQQLARIWAVSFAGENRSASCRTVEATFFDRYLPLLKVSRSSTYIACFARPYRLAS